MKPNVIATSLVAAVVLGSGGIAWARYLQPDPFLQDPRIVAATARMGMSMPAYSYAQNNPLHFTDPTGEYSWRSACPDVGGISRGAVYEQTVFGYRWRRTPGTVGFDNPNGTTCEDCARAKKLRQDAIFKAETFLTETCWEDLVREICSACKEDDNSCPPEKPEPPPGYAAGG